MRSLVCSTAFICLWLASASTAPAQTAESPSVTTASEGPPSPVTIDGRILLQVHGIKAVSASQRAADISKRIVTAVEEKRIKPESITVVETDVSSDIVSGNVILLSVYDADARMEGRNRGELAADWAAKVRTGIEQHFRDRSARSVLTGAGSPEFGSWYASMPGELRPDVLDLLGRGPDVARRGLRVRA